MRDIQRSAAEKLAMFEKVWAAGGFAKEAQRDLEGVEKLPRTLARWKSALSIAEIGRGGEERLTNTDAPVWLRVQRTYVAAQCEEC